MQYITFLVGAVALISPVFAQTWTSCNPLNTTCPNDPALGISHDFVFNTSTAVTSTFNVTAGSITYGTNGAEFTVAKKGDSPTIQSQWYIFFGSVSVIMQAATGQGIISSIVLESDDLDEVDWEFLGGNGTHAETNYFGKGNTTSFDRAIYYPVGADPREGFHNYTVYWTSDQLQWYIDGNLVRTLPYAAANGGNNYPQTPMTVRLGIWAGGDPDNAEGTIEWAGGETNYAGGPYTMYVQSAQVNDFGSGSAYSWSDHSGTWQSIKTIAGNSTAAETLNEVPSKSVAQKWAELSPTAKIAIYCGAAAGAILVLSLLICTCIRQRRAGRRQRDAYNAKTDQERDQAYRDQMELREKGLGGWDDGEYASQGEDTLGGWGGAHIVAGSRPGDMIKEPAVTTTMTAKDIGLTQSPTLPRVSRMQSPVIASPQPRSPQWNGGNSGGLIADAGKAYSGGYGGRSRDQGYADSYRSPIFPLSPQSSQRGYGQSYGGYQRF